MSASNTICESMLVVACVFVRIWLRHLEAFSLVVTRLIMLIFCEIVILSFWQLKLHIFAIDIDMCTCSFLMQFVEHYGDWNWFVAADTVWNFINILWFYWNVEIYNLIKYLHQFYNIQVSNKSATHQKLFSWFSLNAPILLKTNPKSSNYLNYHTISFKH